MTSSRLSLILRDAPLRTALELYFHTAGIRNYVIDNAVFGLVSGAGRVSADEFPRTLFPMVVAERQGAVTIVKQRRLDARSEQLRAGWLTLPPKTSGRVAGLALVNDVPLEAIVELGVPPESAVTLVQRGTRLGDATVVSLGRSSVSMVVGRQQTTVPLGGLVRSSRPLLVTKAPTPTDTFAADASLAGILALIGRARHQQVVLNSVSTARVSGAFVLAQLPFGLPVALAYTNINGVWAVEVRQGSTTTPASPIAEERVTALTIATPRLALIEGPGLGASGFLVVAEGESCGGKTVEQITRNSVRLRDGNREQTLTLAASK